MHSLETAEHAFIKRELYMYILSQSVHYWTLHHSPNDNHTVTYFPHSPIQFMDDEEMYASMEDLDAQLGGEEMEEEDMGGEEGEGEVGGEEAEEEGDAATKDEL